MTSHPAVDILMITHQRADYVAVTLPRLLETCGSTARVWLWHNGDDEPTLEALRPFLTDERVARFHHSRENVRLLTPTNWLMEGSEAALLSKVDDDCVLPIGWIETLATAHQDVPGFGVIGCWRFRPEDYVPHLADRKLATFGNHVVLHNHWVQGSGFLMKRECVLGSGPLRRRDTFTSYCIRLAEQGWVNGWYHPFLQEDHLDDPRSALTGLRTDDDLRRRMPLTAQRLGISTLEEWEKAVRRSARTVQGATLDLRYYSDARRRLRALRDQPRRALSKLWS